MAKLIKIKHKIDDVIAGRYKVVGMLGKPGGMGTVYKVQDKMIDVFYACKEMDIMDDPTTAEDEREIWMENFRREAQVLAELHNEHIPSAHFIVDNSVNLVCPECGETFFGTPLSPCHGKKPVVIKERYYLMMSLIEGENLEEICHGHPLEEEKVLKWMIQICNALKAMHNRNLLHRDVKPENIMIDNNGKAFLVDLGLVKVEAKKLLGTYGTREMSKTGAFGTYGYAPPEQEKGEELDGRTDIYALGMTMYRVLTGRDPKIQNELIQMLDNPPRFFNSNISEQTESIILRAIQQKPENRYQSIDDMLDDIKAPIGTTRPILKFPNGDEAKSIPQLATLMEKNASDATEALYRGYIEQSLGGAGEIHYADAARAVVSQYSDDRDLGLRALIQILHGKMRFTGGEASTPKQIAQLIDRSWEQGKTYLYNGFMSLWLKYAQHKTLVESADRITY